jgi:hypothetical protein
MRTELAKIMSFGVFEVDVRADLPEGFTGSVAVIRIFQTDER